MTRYKITCDDCGQDVTHICDEDFKEAVLRLMTWVPEGAWSSPEMYEAFKAESARQHDDYDFDKLPFFGSQAWTYLIWHKEDARTFHALLHHVIRAAGLDVDSIRQHVHEKIKQDEDDRKTYEERRERGRQKRAAREAEKGKG